MAIFRCSLVPLYFSSPSRTRKRISIRWRTTKSNTSDLVQVRQLRPNCQTSYVIRSRLRLKVYPSLASPFISPQSISPPPLMCFGSDIVIDNPYVSREHFEVYSILYDDAPAQPPMVYVRDRQSLQGTYVNGRCIGSKVEGRTPGYLLNSKDVISIAPYWEFRIKLLEIPSTQWSFKPIQAAEIHVWPSISD